MSILKKLLVGLSLSLAVKAETLNVGVSIPETGPMAEMGSQIKKGLIAAYQSSPKANRQLELSFYDDRCDAKEAVSVANKIIARRNIPLVIGSVCSSATQAVVGLYAEEGIAIMSPASTNEALSDPKTLFARVVVNDANQSQEIVNFLLSKYKGKRIAIVHDNDAYGKGLSESIFKNPSVKALNVVVNDGIIKGEKDFTSFVNTLNSYKVDVLVYLGYYNEAALIVKKIKATQSPITAILSEAACSANFLSILQTNTTNLVCFGTPSVTSIPETKVMLDRLKAMNIKLELYGIYAFAIYQVYLDAAQRHSTGEAIMQEIRSGYQYNTLIGRINFDANGDIRGFNYKPMSYNSTKNNELEVIQ